MTINSFEFKVYDYFNLLGQIIHFWDQIGQFYSKELLCIASCPQPYCRDTGRTSDPAKLKLAWLGYLNLYVYVEKMESLVGIWDSAQTCWKIGLLLESENRRK